MFDKIKELRVYLGLTQEELADDLNIPLRSYQNWESETRDCPDYVADYIEKYLHDSIYRAEIIYRNDYERINGEIYEGYVCNIKTKQPNGKLGMSFSWFIPVKDGMITDEIINKITELQQNDWDIHFY